MATKDNLAAWARLSIAERLKFLAVVNFDFTHAAHAMDLAQRRAKSPTVEDPQKDERYITFSEAAVIRYSRPFFETNAGSEKMRLPVTYLNSLSPTEMERHKSVIDLRRQVSAHSDNSFKLVTLRRVRSGNQAHWDTLVGYRFFAPKELSLIQTVIEKIVRHVRADLDAYADQLFPNTPVGKEFDLP